MAIYFQGRHVNIAASRLCQSSGIPLPSHELVLQTHISRFIKVLPPYQLVHIAFVDVSEVLLVAKVSMCPQEVAIAADHLHEQRACCT